MNPVYWYMGLGVIAISAIIGLIAKFWLDKSDSDMEITWPEYGLALLAISVLLVPITVWRGSEIARNNLKSFNENINAIVTSVSISEKQCTRDGECQHTYECDGYRCSYSCDSDGDGESDDTCWKTCYHSCPYCKVEWALNIHTNTDSWSGRSTTIARHIIPPEADVELRWRQDVAIPGGILQQYSGFPQIFVEAYNNLRDGSEAMPYVFRRKYDSYTLAANVDNPDEWLPAIEQLRTNGLMPTMQTQVTANNRANRVYFSGIVPTPNQYAQWNNTLSFIESAFGNDRQGDLHILIINKGGLDMSIESVVQAVKYDWQNSSRYGDNTFAKNGVLVALETNDNATISRAALVTGMPEEVFALQYNDDLIAAVSNTFLQSGIPLDPAIVLGKVTIPLTPMTEACSMFKCFRGVGPSEFSEGVLTNLIFGLEQPDLAYQRLSMSAEDPEDVGPGFVALDELIVPNAKQQKTIMFVATFVSMAAWVVAIIAGERYRPYRRRYGRFSRF